MTAFPCHHCLSGPSSKIAKCKCGARGSAFPVDPTKPMTSPRSNPHPLAQPFRVPVQVRVVVAIRAHFVELVDRVAARFAEEQLADGSRYDRMHGRPSRLQNVDRLMRMSVVNFFERIPQIREGKSADGRRHLQNGGVRADGTRHIGNSVRRCKHKASTLLLQIDRCAPSNHVRQVAPHPSSSAGYTRPTRHARYFPDQASRGFHSPVSRARSTPRRRDCSDPARVPLSPASCPRSRAASGPSRTTGSAQCRRPSSDRSAEDRASPRWWSDTAPVPCRPAPNA